MPPGKGDSKGDLKKTGGNLGPETNSFSPVFSDSSMWSLCH